MSRSDLDSVAPAVVGGENGRGDPRGMGWLFVDQEDIPPRWRSRMRPVYFVSLLPEELRTLLAGRAEDPLDIEDAVLLRMVAQGLSIRQMSSKLGVTTRTVQRRLVRLRARYGLSSTAELAVLLAERGF